MAWSAKITDIVARLGSSTRHVHGRLDEEDHLGEAVEVSHAEQPELNPVVLVRWGVAAAYLAAIRLGECRVRDGAHT